jgi:hypothetical protein
MNIDEFYKKLLILKYELLFNRNNFNIYQDNNNFLISGLIDIKKNKLIDHLKKNKSLLENHKAILYIENLDKKTRYFKIKLLSDYIDYPLIDFIEECNICSDKNKTFIYSFLKEIPYNIKEKQCLEYVSYLESGYFLIVIEEINDQSKIEIFISTDNFNPILLPALMKNFTIILIELKNI